MNEEPTVTIPQTTGDGRQVEYEVTRGNVRLPEPVYEYRVVCDDGVARYFVGKITDAAVADGLRREATPWCTRLPFPHHHTVERRTVGPWEAT